MPTVVGIFAVLVMLVSLAATFATYPILWRGFREQWRRIPAERRPRAVAGGVATAAIIAAGVAVAIAAPWGRDSIVYVLLFGGGGLMVVLLFAVGVQGVRESRRARRHRRFG
jgi:hypothetical protein